MQTNKKVLITFIFALIFAFLNASTIKSAECKPLDAVIDKVESADSNTTKFLISAKGAQPGLYDAMLGISGNIPNSGIVLHKASFKIEEKKDKKPPYDVKLEFIVPATYNDNYYTKNISISPNTCGEPIKNPKTCFAYYNFRFFCPEEDTSSMIFKSQRQGIDVVFVVDRSETVKPIVENMKKGILGVLGAFNQSIDRVGLIGFGDAGYKIVSLTTPNNISLVKSAINNWKPGANTTNLASGIEMATSMYPKNSKNKKIMIVVSDGVVNNSTDGQCLDKESYPLTANKCTNDALLHAKLAQQLGISIYSVGYNFAYTDTVKKNAGDMAKSVMKNIASCSECFFDNSGPAKPRYESRELANLVNIFINIINKNVGQKTTQVAGGCSNVNVKFNFNSLIAQNFKFYSGQSSAYRGYDLAGISWNYGNINAQGEQSNFTISTQVGEDQDFETILKKYGLGNFVATYKDKNGQTKEIAFSHDEILNHMFANSSVDDYLGQTYFAANFYNAGCGRVPEIKVIEEITPPQITTKTKGEYIVKRIPYTDDCGTARIDISITCSDSNGCNAMNFIDQFSGDFVYKQKTGEIIDSCILPESDSAIANKFIACTIPESDKEVQSKKTYYLQTSKSGNLPTNDNSRFAYIDNSGKQIFFDKGNVDIVKCADNTVLSNLEFICNEQKTQNSVPNDIVLVLDFSGSMFTSMESDNPNIISYNRPDIDRLKEGVREFLNIVDSKDRVAMVQFGDVRKISDLIYINKQNINSLLEQIPNSSDSEEKKSSMSAGRDTDMAAGIDIGLEIMKNAQKDRPEARKVMILFSDGAPNIAKSKALNAKYSVSQVMTDNIQEFYNEIFVSLAGYYPSRPNDILSVIHLNKEAYVINRFYEILTSYQNAVGCQTNIECNNLNAEQKILRYSSGKFLCYTSPKCQDEDVLNVLNILYANINSEKKIVGNLVGMKRGGSNSIYLSYLSSDNMKDSFLKAFNRFAKPEKECRDASFIIDMNGVSGAIFNEESNKEFIKNGNQYIWKLPYDLGLGESMVTAIGLKTSDARIFNNMISQGKMYCSYKNTDDKQMKAPLKLK